MRITAAPATSEPAGDVVLVVVEDGLSSDCVTALNRRLDGGIARAVAASGFSGKAGDDLLVHAGASSAISRALLIGSGPSGKWGPRQALRTGGTLAAASRRYGINRATLSPGAVDDLAQVALGAALGTYRFDRYRTPEGDRKGLEEVVLFGGGDVQRLAALADATDMARDLVNEPPNMLTPLAFARHCETLRAVGIEVEVLDRARLEALGMATLLAVARGSANSPAVVVMRWRGSVANDAPVVLVGKGVTFDSGGLCLKPRQHLEELKYDMAGAAVVTAAMASLAATASPAHVVGLIGLVENMPDGGASRPGDVVRSLGGLTVEIVNTDAEGRLVLADLLAYAVRELRPASIIDLATLTGAVVYALGDAFAGIFSTDAALAARLIAAGQATGERLWRLPLDDAFEAGIRSPFADLKNMGKPGHAGASYAAQFLSRFVGDVPWAHLDIAGVAWASEPHPLGPVGGTGFGVRLIDAFLHQPA